MDPKLMVNYCLFCHKGWTPKASGYFAVCENKHFNPCHKQCSVRHTGYNCQACKEPIIGATKNRDIFNDERKLKNMKVACKRNRTLIKNSIDQTNMEASAIEKGILTHSRNFASLLFDEPEKYEEYKIFVKEWKREKELRDKENKKKERKKSKGK